MHAIISTADALLVFVRGFRYAGTRHEGAVELFSGIFPGEPEHEKNVSHFGTILSIKNKAEYLEVLLSSKDATDTLRDATRFFELREEQASEIMVRGTACHERVRPPSKRATGGRDPPHPEEMPDSDESGISGPN